MYEVQTSWDVEILDKFFKIKIVHEIRNWYMHESAKFNLQVQN